MHMLFREYYYAGNFEINFPPENRTVTDFTVTILQQYDTYANKSVLFSLETGRKWR